MTDWIGVDMADVTWLPAPRLDGYEISSDGHLRSLDRVVVDGMGRRYERRGRVLKASMGSYGYYILNVKALKTSGRGVNVSIHRLMCEAFHGAPPFDGAVVRHLNGVRTDNRPENLAWGTPAENTADMFDHGNHCHQRKTHCSNGHAFDAVNTRIIPIGRGRRQCRACDREMKRASARRING